jgi:4-hydroxy-4-methyl-2-oxoglutarate aldolase
MPRSVTALEQLDACAVSDALDSLGLPGSVVGITRLSTDARVCGEVTTVRLVPVGAAVVSSRHLGTAAIEASGPGHVIVVGNGGRMDVSGWGGNLSLAAAGRGIRAVIVDGACRDIDESREFGLPVFARGTVTRTARGRVVEDGWNVPVSIGGVAVEPGDFVVADGSGVVFVPRARVGEVIEKAAAIMEKERQMAERIRAGVPVSEVMGANYETMLGERS